MTWLSARLSTIPLLRWGADKSSSHVCCERLIVDLRVATSLVRQYTSGKHVTDGNPVLSTLKLVLWIHSVTTSYILCHVLSTALLVILIFWRILLIAAVNFFLYWPNFLYDSYLKNKRDKIREFGHPQWHIKRINVILKHKHFNHTLFSDILFLYWVTVWFYLMI